MLLVRTRLKPANPVRCIYPVFRRFCTTLGHNSDSDAEEDADFEQDYEEELMGKTYNTQYKVSHNSCQSPELL